MPGDRGSNQKLLASGKCIAKVRSIAGWTFDCLHRRILPGCDFILESSIVFFMIEEMQKKSRHVDEGKSVRYSAERGEQDQRDETKINPALSSKIVRNFSRKVFQK